LASLKGETGESSYEMFKRHHPEFGDITEEEYLYILQTTTWTEF